MYRAYAHDVTHYIVALFSGYYLAYFRYNIMSDKRVVGSTAIIEIRAAWKICAFSVLVVGTK